LNETLIPSEGRPVVEMDELWFYVGSKENKVWIWLALDAVSKQIVGFAFGSRGEPEAQKLWDSLPADYRKRAILFSDHWEAYSKVLPSKRHFPVDKQSGKTSHIERLNNTLRQRCSNLVRKTLSYSKKLEWHIKRIVNFILHYNEIKYKQWKSV